ncbi:MAG TPA: FAD-dependent oxidoreductase [Burkholderiaceae bacterium]|nr:FAD-dependent oxidoreductase [Burkholderiaceae bacterium]
MTRQDFDFIVIGAGMAGMSVAAELSRGARVAVVERESQPGYHATGRSAALYSEIYGNRTIRALTRASKGFYMQPPQGFSAHALVAPRGTLYFAVQAEEAALDAFAATLAGEFAPARLDETQARALIPAFKRGYLSRALLEPESFDIDVAAVLQGFAAICRGNGVHYAYDSAVSALTRDGEAWCVATPGATLCAPVVINAAGAWGDEIAGLAGAAPVGLVPKRRSALLIDVPGGAPARGWPAAIHVGETFYFKPDAGLLLLSPADETPCAPCDAQPEELDIAVAVDRFETATGQAVGRVRSRWAGLRSFVADKSPVVGFDPSAAGFFWLVGQGGYGIQTAPAMARAASALAQRRPLPDDLLAHGVRAEDLAPGRPTLREA